MRIPQADFFGWEGKGVQRGTITLFPLHFKVTRSQYNIKKKGKEQHKVNFCNCILKLHIIIILSDGTKENKSKGVAQMKLL